MTHGYGLSEKAQKNISAPVDGTNDPGLQADSSLKVSGACTIKLYRSVIKKLFR